MKVKYLLIALLLLSCDHEAVKPVNRVSALAASNISTIETDIPVDSNFYLPDSVDFKLGYECFLVTEKGKRIKKYLNEGDFQYGDTNVYTRLSMGALQTRSLSKFHFVNNGWKDQDVTNNDTFSFRLQTYRATYYRVPQILTIKKGSQYIVQNLLCRSFNEFKDIVMVKLGVHE